VPPTYFAIWTTLGLQRLAEAVANATPLVFTHFAVGDGGGAPIIPDASMTSLVQEEDRQAVNSVEIDPSAPTTIRVEAIFPAATGGFTIREAGIFNGAGELIAVASHPPIYKTTPADGVSVDTYIRMLLVYVDVTAVSLTVDTSVVVPSRKYVDDADTALSVEITALTDAVDLIRKGLESYFLFRDDFQGAVDPKWTLSGGGAGITNITDVAAGGFGAMQFAADGTNTGPNIQLVSLPVGTKDFYVASRSRASVDNAGSNAVIGFTDGTNFAEWVGVGGGNWTASYGSGPSTHDSGIAVDSTYHYFLIARFANTVFFFIDGVLKHSAALATNFGNTNLVVGATRASGAGLTHQSDFVSVWVKRV
jgi:hypothetical protein